MTNSPPASTRQSDMLKLLAAPAGILFAGLVFYVGLRGHALRSAEARFDRTNAAAGVAIQSAADTAVQSTLRARARAGMQLLESFRRESIKTATPEAIAKEAAGHWLLAQRIEPDGYLLAFDKDAIIKVHPLIKIFKEVGYLDFSSHDYVRDILKRAQTPGAGDNYVEFEWREPGQTKRVPMAAGLAFHEPWQWVVCAAMPAKGLGGLAKLPPPVGAELEKLSGGAGFRSFAVDAAGDAILVLAPDDVAVLAALSASDGWQALQKGSPEQDAPPRRLELAVKMGDAEKPADVDVLLRYLPRTNWWAVTAVERRRLHQPLAGLRNVTVTLTLLLAALAAGATLLLRRRQTRKAVVERDQTREMTDNQVLELERKLGNARTQHTELMRKNEQLNTWMGEAQQTSRESTLLKQMGDLLQACRSTEETYEIIIKLARELFPNDSGALFTVSETQSVLETSAVWGESLKGEGEFLPDDCWALRRGKTHIGGREQSDLVCQHLPEAPAFAYMCLPMMAHGEVLGMLHLQCGPPDATASDEENVRQLDAKRRLATTVTEQFGLALANLKLREALRVQSIRDQLTGLFNRRHMEESLTRELHRAKRKNSELGLIMLDVDHFKQYNDTYGHEEGDNLLKGLGNLLRKNVRQDDIACRYGGEEFLIIMPDASLEITRQRAEFLRREVRERLRIPSQKETDSAVTISLGVAVFPEDGDTAEELIPHADAALYRAKDQGRDRVVVWQAARE